MAAATSRSWARMRRDDVDMNGLSTADANVDVVADAEVGTEGEEPVVVRGGAATDADAVVVRESDAPWARTDRGPGPTADGSDSRPARGSPSRPTRSAPLSPPAKSLRRKPRSCRPGVGKDNAAGVYTWTSRDLRPPNGSPPLPCTLPDLGHNLPVRVLLLAGDSDGDEAGLTPHRHASTLRGVGVHRTRGHGRMPAADRHAPGPWGRGRGRGLTTMLGEEARAPSAEASTEGSLPPSSAGKVT